MITPPNRPWFLSNKGKVIENLIGGEDRYTADLNLDYFTGTKIRTIVALRKNDLGYFADDLNPRRETDAAYRSGIIYSMRKIIDDPKTSKELALRLFRSVDMMHPE